MGRCTAGRVLRCVFVLSFCVKKRRARCFSPLAQQRFELWRQPSCTGRRQVEVWGPLDDMDFCWPISFEHFATYLFFGSSTFQNSKAIHSLITFGAD